LSLVIYFDIIYLHIIYVTFSYALAIWTRRKKIHLIEFYNEPDLDLGVCLDSNRFKDFYQIRSLSIQQAYQDLNSEEMNQNNWVNPKILASAFARRTFGGDTTRFLGEIVVQNNYVMFATNQSTKQQSSWANMDYYSYHSYGKIGSDLGDDSVYLQNSINQAQLLMSRNHRIPLVITEHNTHTSSDWNTINSTADDDFEASRLASQIVNLILNNVRLHYVFKFSVTPSFSANRQVAMNG
jgi:hypothetical protein